MSGSMNEGRGSLDHLLGPAKQLGNVSGLRRLVAALRTENVSVEVLDIVFHHIRYGLPNPRPQYKWGDDYPPMSNTVTCAAICANEALYVLTHTCPPSLYPQMHSRIVAHFDELMDCLNFLLWYPDYSRQAPVDSICNPTKACVALIIFLNHAEDLQAELVQSRKVIDYAIGAWAVQDFEGIPYIASASTDTCPTVKLLHSVLTFSPECEQSVFDLLGGEDKQSKFLLKRVVENAILRCDNTTQTQRGPHEEHMRWMLKRQHQSLADATGNHVISALEAKLLYLNSVQSVVECLCQNPIVARSFLTSRYFESFSEALKSWMVLQSDKEADRQQRYIGFAMATAAQGLAVTQGAKYRKLSLVAQLSMVHGGLLHLLVEAMQSIPRSDKEHANCVEQMLLMMKQMCSRSPALGAMLVKPLKQVRLNAADVSFIRGTGYEEMWRSFALHVTASSAVDMMKEKPVICDYMECSGTKKRNPQACSGCHTLSYCSKSCQKKDWNLQHRNECSKARAETVELRSKGLHYSQRLRLLHGLFTCALANTHLAERNFDLAVGQLTAVLHYYGWAHNPILPQDYLKMHGWLVPGPSGDVLTLNHYLDRRFQRLVLHYVKHAGTSGLRLVEYQYPFGDRFALTLALLQKTSIAHPEKDDTLGKYTLKYRVSRMLSVDQSKH